MMVFCYHFSWDKEKLFEVTVLSDLPKIRRQQIYLSFSAAISDNLMTVTTLREMNSGQE